MRSSSGLLVLGFVVASFGCGSSTGSGGAYVAPDGAAGTDGGGTADSATQGDASADGTADGAAQGDASVDGTGAGDGSGDSSGGGTKLVVKKGHNPSGKTWTVLVYMDADNNLEPDGVDDLLEMAQVGSNDAVKIVVQVDRAAGHSDAPIGNLGNFTDAKRVLVNKGGFELLETVGEPDRANPKVLADFLAWGLQKYPADRVALVLWNHGAGVNGFATDDSAADPNHTMSLVEMAGALQQGLQQGGRERLDLIGFDACLMASFEVAATVAPYAEYLLASEELEPGHGWNWTSLQQLRDDPAVAVPALGKRIGDDFLAYGVQAGTESGITLSLIDLTELDAVGAAVDALSAWVAKGFPATVVPVGRARADAFEFGRSAPSEPGHNAFDLGELASRMVKDGAIDAGVLGDLQAALAKAVVYKTAGKALAFSSGLTVNFPPQQTEDLAAHATTPGVAGWRAMLDGYWSGGKVAGKAAFASADGIAEAKLVDGELTFWGDLKPGHGKLVVDASAHGGVVDPATQTLIILASWPAELQGDKVHSSWAGEYLQLSDGTTTAPVYTDTTVFADGTVLLEAYLMRTVGGDTDVVVYRIYLDAKGNIDQTGLFLFDDGGVGSYAPVAGEVLQPLVLQVDADENIVPVAASQVGFDPTKLEPSLAQLTQGTAVALLTVESADGSEDGVALAVPLSGGGGGGAVCGNGACEAGENASACPKDCGCTSNAACGLGKICEQGVCVADPESCVGRCGTFDAQAMCQCDADCGDNGDCCPDINAACP